MLTTKTANAARVATRPQPSSRRALALKAYSSTSQPRCITPASSMRESEAAIKALGQVCVCVLNRHQRSASPAAIALVHLNTSNSHQLCLHTTHNNQQAYISHRWCRELQIRLGKEHEFFQGLARLQLDTFSDAPVLLLLPSASSSSSSQAEQQQQQDSCKAAGILLSSQQEAHLIQALQDTELSVIAGSLQILHTVPEARLQTLIQQLKQLQEASAQAATDAGHAGSYLKLVCLGVRPDAQGQGLGRALLSAALAQAQQGRQLVCADVADASAVEMLQRHGFKAVGACGLFTQLVWHPL